MSAPISTPHSTLDAGQVAVLEGIATGVPLPRLLTDIVLLVERQANGMLCSILLLDEQNCLRHGAAPTLPREFIDAIDGSRIGPAAGSCGTAAFTKRPMIAHDIANNAAWTEYKHFALPAGLRACWSTPILSPTGDVLGTFAMYYREIRTPNASEERWVALATHLAAIAIMRERTVRELRRSERRATELARLHAVSSAITKSIARDHDLGEVYDRACRAAVQLGFATLAWIGLGPNAEGRIDVVAHHGKVPMFDTDHFDLHQYNHESGIMWRALQTRQPVISSDLAADTPVGWREPIIARGLKSCGLFPLVADEGVIGVFTFCADSLNYFREEEVQVLSALASDISFAIVTERKERERRQMQEAVRAGDRLRALIFDAVAQALFYLEVEGPDRYRFVSVNRAFHELFGSDDTRVVGRYLAEAVPDAMRQRVLERYREAIGSKARVTWEEETVSRAGVKHVEIGIVPLFDANGQCTNFVGTVHDVTARKRAEEERARLAADLNQSQRLQALGTLAGGIAHDFNNILAAISGNAGLLLQESTLDPMQRTHAHEIRKASLRAIELVRQILTFSRDAPPKRETLDASAVVNEALQMLRATLPQTIAIESRSAADAPRIEGDATQLHQIVTNLCTNAAHAMPTRGGIIRISVDGVTLTTNPNLPRLLPGRYLRLRVADNGCGMDELTVKRAFDPFFTTRKPGEGTGLGLSVVHGIVESHHGAIELESAIGKGTLVTVYLPASAAVPESEPAQEPSKGQGQRVMYVDDEEALVFLIDRALTKLGYRVSGFADAAIALSTFRQQPDAFDIVITDLSMPGLSGPDLAAELRRIRADVPIIMTSGYVRAEDVAMAERLGINQLIYKANTIEELGAALAKEIALLSQKNDARTASDS